MSFLGYKTSNFYGLNWVRIFHHNSRYGYFENIGNALFSPKKSQKFSVLGSLCNDFKINDVFEFLLEYPEIDESLRWNQTVNPLEETNVVNYEPINVSSKFSSFRGLARSGDKRKSLLDGTPHNSYENWWFSVGAMVNEFNGKVPVYLNGTKAFSTYVINLWLKIESFDKIKILPILSPYKCSCKKGSINKFSTISFAFIFLS